MSPHRQRSRVIARIALGSALLLALDGTAVGLAPAASAAAASPATIAGTTVATSTAALQARTPIALGAPLATTTTAVGTVSTGPVAASTTTAIRTSAYTEGSSIIRYAGTWSNAFSRLYNGGRAKYARKAGASATIRVSGLGVSWIGPVGPTRGAARIYFDGRLVKTVSTYARTFASRRTIYSRQWSTAGNHTLKIVVVGTAHHPIVAIDSITIKRRVTVTSPTTPAPATSGRTVTVSSIASLKSVLADNSVGQIVVKNGTYAVSAAGRNASNSLWIGSRYASRTRAVLVRAETRGGVTFDGGGAAYFGGISFENNAHDQTWDGFNFAHGTPTSTGVVTFGGYTNQAGAPYRITMRHIRILSSVRGTVPHDHAFYISATPTVGPHDLTFEDISVDGSGGITSAFNFGKAWGANAWNVVVRRLTATNLNMGIVVWEGQLHNLLFDQITIRNSARFGVRYENGSDRAVMFRNVVTTGSRQGGFYSSLGIPPPGVTFVGNSFH